MTSIAAVAKRDGPIESHAVIKFLIATPPRRAFGSAQQALASTTPRRQSANASQRSEDERLHKPLPYETAARSAEC